MDVGFGVATQTTCLDLYKFGLRTASEPELLLGYVFKVEFIQGDSPFFTDCQVFGRSVVEAESTMGQGFRALLASGPSATDHSVLWLYLDSKEGWEEPESLEWSVYPNPVGKTGCLREAHGIGSSPLFPALDGVPAASYSVQRHEGEGDSLVLQISLNHGFPVEPEKGILGRSIFISSSESPDKGVCATLHASKGKPLGSQDVTETVLLIGDDGIERVAGRVSISRLRSAVPDSVFFSDDFGISLEFFALFPSPTPEELSGYELWFAAEDDLEGSALCPVWSSDAGWERLNVSQTGMFSVGQDI